MPAASHIPLDASPSPAPFHVMAKPQGALCNLACAYCYYLRKEQLYAGSDFRMSDALLERFVRQYIASQPAAEVTFVWQGGEPTLLGLEFYERAVRYQQQYARPGMRIHNALQTNATLLDEDWCRFFKEHDFLLGVSIDGPRQLHDAFRRNKGGGGSYAQALRGWRLLQAQGVEANVLCTVHAANQGRPLAVYRFLRDELAARFIQFIPIVEREGEGASARSVTAEAYGDFLIAIFDEWQRRDVGKVFVQLFDVALAAWLGRPGGLCIFAPTCGGALLLEHNGDLYACDHFVQPEFLLGNIEEEPLLALAASERQRRFGRDKLATLPHACRVCEVRFACHGGCPKNRFIHTAAGEPGLNYLCAGYKAFFRHVDPPMRRMAALLRRG